MLKELTIKNFAIIEDINLEFHDQMNVFLGETGAGKSIIVNAFSLLLGNRAFLENIRKGEQKAFVEAKVYLERSPSSLNDFDLDNKEFVFTRIINKKGNNICKINGQNTTSQVLKQTLGKIVNIHSQHDQHTLLNEEHHLLLLDTFANFKVKKKKEEFKKEYQKLKQLKKEKEELLKNSQLLDKDFINFKLKELEELDTNKDEYENLYLEEKRILNYKKNSDLVESILNNLNGKSSILEKIYEIKNLNSQFKEDKQIQNDFIKIENIYYELESIYENFKTKYSNIDLDPKRLTYIQDKIFKINKIKKKVGSSFSEYEQEIKKLKKQLLNIEDKDYVLKDLEKNIKEHLQITKNKAKELSKLRKSSALLLENKIKEQLKDLYLENTIFKVAFDKKELSEDGLDEVCFLIATNVGEDLKKLSLIASGGETSRLTFGINIVLNELFKIELSIFDEVDTGISGKVASAIGKKLYDLSRNYQILVISHLPQVLAKGDRFFLVRKKVENHKTKVYVEILSLKERTHQIAKIISGKDEPSKKAIESAKELIKS